MVNIKHVTNEIKLLKPVIAIVLKSCSWDYLLRPKIGSLLTSTTINQILHTLSKLESFLNITHTFFKWVELNPDYKHTLQSNWTMIHILTKQKHFKTAHQLLDKIALRDFLSSPTVLNSLASTCDDPDVNCHVLSLLVIYYANMKMTQDAIQVFEHMRVHGLKLHLPACTVLLNTLVKERLTDTMWKCYKKMVKIGIVANLHIYNVLIHACCKSLDVEKAEEVIAEMEFKCVSPDLFTYNTLISLYCKKGFAECTIMMKMEAKGLFPGTVTYKILRKLCEESRIKDANKLLIEMSGNKVVPDNVTCNTLINAYCKIGDMNSALKVRDMENAKEFIFSMIYDGFSPNYCTYSWLVDLYCSQKNEEVLVKLPDEFYRKGIIVDISIYRALIRRLCKQERVDCAQRLFDIMQSKGISGDSVVFTNLAYAYLKAGDTTIGLKIFDEMYKMRLMITHNIHKMRFLTKVFWNLAVERGLLSRNTLKQIYRAEEYA
ncbi:tetratricopeptide repeat (TPR)-like superfamily protein [Artemisia annua]|uniref:Tetratricopeptide repeat (TPR)-like superfamily protein n=1 Tax=Artemisia annua TaxID=35608 RepID=A0A2U1QP08_ARTAN|nr:tetratricopeptide repeat (TPR)-like superfamily protein [Artemisia annua]